MKLSVSLSPDDVATLDLYARVSGLKSRSAAIQHAIRLLRETDLEQDYAAAWTEWDLSGEREVWEAAAADGTAADGTADAAR
ncbi:MAG TPA: ribbon-helix-helix domain-containing protein [Mycobacteriales bacterium]